jgi:hypothetical protein
MKASLLGCDAAIEVAESEGHAKLIVPPINPDNMKSSELYAFRIEKE